MNFYQSPVQKVCIFSGGKRAESYKQVCLNYENRYSINAAWRLAAVPWDALVLVWTGHRVFYSINDKYKNGTLCTS